MSNIEELIEFQLACMDEEIHEDNKRMHRQTAEVLRKVHLLQREAEECNIFTADYIRCLFGRPSKTKGGE